MKLGTIEEEAAACRKAWKGSKARYAWHCHHETLAEELSGPAEERIMYILTNKPEEERALRLRLFRPVRDDAALASAREAYDAAYASAQKAYDAATASAQEAYDAAIASAQKAFDAALAPAHAKECPDCPWNGKTIFP